MYEKKNKPNVNVVEIYDINQDKLLSDQSSDSEIGSKSH